MSGSGAVSASTRDEGSLATFVAPQRPRRYAYFNGAVLDDNNKAVLAFPSVWSRTSSDNYEEFLKATSLGSVTDAVSREELTEMQYVDPSRQIDVEQLPADKTLVEMLSRDTSDLDFILSELLLLEDGRDTTGKYVRYAKGWRSLSLVDMPIDRGQAIANFPWQTSSSRQARPLPTPDLQGFQSIPYDTVLAVIHGLRNKVERVFEGADGSPQSMKFTAGHCLRADRSAGPGLLVELSCGKGQIMSMRAQLAAFEKEPLGSAEWKSLEADYFTLALEERDLRTVSCVTEVWRKTAESVRDSGANSL